MHPQQKSHSGTVLLLLVCILPILLTSGCQKGNPVSLHDAFSGGSDNIITGASVDLTSKSIDASGGTMRVEKTGDPLNGLQITLPSNTYAESKTFTISYAPITKHNFGPNFNPVSPLIQIENGGDFSAKVITVRIPVSTPADKGVMAFYYDKEKGTLEGIATIGRGEGYIDIGVRHFSLIVLSEFQKNLLIQGGGYSSFFDPKTNGWPFVNYGTFPAQGGVCSGMSIGAGHFYRNFEASLQIRSFFDNDKLWFLTPSLLYDDAGAMKFVTEIQNTFVADPNYKKLGPILFAPEDERFWNLIYAMLINNQPQIIYLDVKDDPSAPAHAILAFGYTINQAEATIKVYDPNYPDNTGEIVFDMGTKKFRPYTSAANAGALANGSTYNFNIISYMPLSTIFSKAALDKMFQKVLGNTIGNGIFPKYDLYAVNRADPNSPRIKLSDAHASGRINMLPFADFDIEIEAQDKNIDFRLASCRKFPGDTYDWADPIKRLHLDEQEVMQGIYVSAKPAGGSSYLWCGYHWFKMKQGVNITISPNPLVGEPNKQYSFTAHSESPVPAGAKYVWNFGDGSKEETKTNDSVVVHTFAAAGDYQVEVKLYDNTNALMANATSSATIEAQLIKVLRATKFVSVGVHGKQTHAPLAFEITTIGFIIPIIWSGNDFSVDGSSPKYVQGMSVSGRVSADLSTVVVSGQLRSTDGNHVFTSTISCKNVPFDHVWNSTPGSEDVGFYIGGKDLTNANYSNYLDGLSYLDEYGGGKTNYYVSTDWDDDATVKSVIRVDFSAQY